MRKLCAISVVPAGGFGSEAGEKLDHAQGAPGDDESDDRQCCRLIGPVGADDLQIGTEAGPVQQRGDDELADHDRKGQESSGKDRDENVRQDDP